MQILKNILPRLLVTFSLLFLFQSGLLACEIHLKVSGTQKEKYNPGDIVVVKMTVELTHRRCSESLKETKIDLENLEIIESSNWENNEANIWEKTIKVKVLKNKTGHIGFLGHGSELKFRNIRIKDLSK